MVEYADSALRHYELRGSHLANLKGYESYGAMQKVLAADPTPFLRGFFDSHPWGTPAQTIKRATELAEAFGTDEIMFVFKYGGMPMAQAEKSMRLFAREVMPALKDTEARADRRVMEARRVDFDAIVIGAGFAGLRMLHELRELGLSARVFEAASDVGGTWYWNRYPGARTDSESWVYAYSFSKELQDEWNWSERFPPQPEALAYLQHVADRFDMRKDIVFNTRVESAVYDERANLWTVRDDKGGRHTCRYLISAVGVLSTPYVPPFPGIETFQGEWYVTGRWPKERVDFTGKRVVVIGTGATAIQAIPDHRGDRSTPHRVAAHAELRAARAERPAHRGGSVRRSAATTTRSGRQAREHFFGFAMEPAGRTIADVTPAEHQRILERGWETGGFRFIFESFDDIFIDERSNEVASEFIRNKIRTIVKDPATAELLCPKDYPLTAKRPPLGHFYYETFNRENVSLVDVSGDPITEITAKGVRTASREFEADLIVFATGFDAVTGTLKTMDVRGRSGVTIAEKWKDGPRTHLGIAVDGFPNFFMVLGPQSPFANIPVVIDGMVDWIGKAIRHMRENDVSTPGGQARSRRSLAQARRPAGERDGALQGTAPGSSATTSRASRTSPSSTSAAPACTGTSAWPRRLEASRGSSRDEPRDGSSEAPIEADRRVDRVDVARDAAGDAGAERRASIEPVGQAELRLALAREACGHARAQRDELHVAWVAGESRRVVPIAAR